MAGFRQSLLRSCRNPGAAAILLVATAPSVHAQEVRWRFVERPDHVFGCSQRSDWRQHDAFHFSGRAVPCPEGNGIALVGVTGAALRADGSILIANHEGPRLVAFEAGGRVRWTAAPPGRRAGELEEVVFLGVHTGGDSLLLVDEGLRRVAMFDGQGSHVGTADLRGLPAGAAPVAALLASDGGFHVVARAKPTESEAGAGRSRYWFLYSSREGVVERVVAEFKGSDTYVGSDPPVVGPLPFGRETAIRWYGDDLLISDGTGRIRRIRPDGGEAPPLTPRLPPARPLSASDTRRFIREQINRAPREFREDLARHLASIPFPSELPQVRGLLVDDSGNIWVEEYPAPSSGTATWRVVDGDGQPIAVLRLPAGVRLIAVRGDRIVVNRMVSGSSEEQIAIHRIEKR
jgi:hypothetical protein